MGDILKQIQQDARRLRVARKLPPDGEPIGYDLIALVQEDFEKFLTVTGLSVADVARRMGKGFSAGTLSTWRHHDQAAKEFKGDLDRITRGVNQFMETYAQQATAPRPEGFVETDAAKLMLNVIRETIALRCMTIISSDSGRGKTMTLQAAESVYPGAIYCRVKRGFRSATGLAKLLCHALRIRSARSTSEMQTKIIETLSGTGRVLIFDEAHQLDAGALEFVRDVHDECELPIILAGTRKIDEATDDKDIFFGQFASRVAWRLDLNDYARGSHGGSGPPTRPLHTPEDVKRVFASDQVRLTDDAEAFLARLANVEGFGGLRLCVQIYRVAARIAQDKGREITGELLVQVLREMHGRTRAVRRIETAAADVKVKVA